MGGGTRARKGDEIVKGEKMEPDKVSLEGDIVKSSKLAQELFMMISKLLDEGKLDENPFEFIKIKAWESVVEVQGVFKIKKDPFFDVHCYQRLEFSFAWNIDNERVGVFSNKERTGNPAGYVFPHLQGWPLVIFRAIEEIARGFLQRTSRYANAVDKFATKICFAFSEK